MENNEIKEFFSETFGSNPECLGNSDIKVLVVPRKQNDLLLAICALPRFAQFNAQVCEYGSTSMYIVMGDAKRLKATRLSQNKDAKILAMICLPDYNLSGVSYGVLSNMSEILRSIGADKVIVCNTLSQYFFSMLRLEDEHSVQGFKRWVDTIKPHNMTYFENAGIDIEGLSSIKDNLMQPVFKVVSEFGFTFRKRNVESSNESNPGELSFEDSAIPIPKYEEIDLSFEILSDCDWSIIKKLSMDSQSFILMMVKALKAMGKLTIQGTESLYSVLKILTPDEWNKLLNSIIVGG